MVTTGPWTKLQFLTSIQYHTFKILQPVSTIFSKLDLIRAYHQIPVEPDHIPKPTLWIILIPQNAIWAKMQLDLVRISFLLWLYR